MRSWVLESPEPSQLSWKQERKVLSAAPGQAPHQVRRALASGTRVQNASWVFCLAVLCQEAVPSPPSNYLKGKIQLPPGWIFPIFCLRRPPPAPSPDSLSVCPAVNELPGQAGATLGLCEGLRSNRGLISNKYWFVCKWNSSIYGIALDTQVVTKLPWGQTLSRMLISHLYERQRSRGSEDFCRTPPFGPLWGGSKTGLCNL